MDFWRKCSSCKKPIAFGARYYLCSVSTCNGQRTGYVFCSVPCFERHLPGARHKDAAAVEAHAPAQAMSLQSSSPVAPPVAGAPRRTIVQSSAPANTSANSVTKVTSHEVLVIASRIKEYIQMRSEYNTSAGVMDVLSDHLRNLCDRGIENARADGRKTVMDRDFNFLKNLK